jgi:hypothetical protein
MAIDVENIKQYILYYRGDSETPADEELLYESLSELTNVVIRRQFQFDQNKREDLDGIALLKCIDLLHSDHIDPKRNLTNMLYTGIRNSVGNFLKSEARKASKFTILVDKKSDAILNGEEDVNNVASEFITQVRKLSTCVGNHVEKFKAPPERIEDLNLVESDPMTRAILVTAAYRVLV